MKKIFGPLLFMIVLSVCFCFTAGASDSGYGHVTYVNPFYQDYTMPHYASSGVQNVSTENVVFYTTYEDVGEALLAGLLNREEQITVGYKQIGGTLDTFVDDIFNEALTHTGIPNAGDYLRYTLGGFQCDYRYQPSYNGTVYTLTYYPLYYTNAEQEAAVDAEIDRILAELDVADASEYEKSTAIYDYICSNVVYDYANLNNNLYNLKYTAYAALIDGTAVCQGYATLYYRMALELGLDARVITGFGGNERHAWNIVQIDNLYYNLDATWDAEIPTYQYYLKCDANFPDHQRSQEMLTEEFYAAYPMSQEDYTLSQIRGTCGEELNWTLDKDGTLTISGTGKMYDYGYDSEDGTRYTYSAKPWEAYGNVKKLVVEEGVTSIGYAAFIHQTQLEEIVFHPDSIIEIGAHAFANTQITNPVVFPASLCRIGNYAFEGSSISGTVTFGDKLEKIGDFAFSQCSSITELSFPATLQSIGKAAFYGCSLLKDAVFAGSSPEIGNMAFASTSADLTFTYSEGASGWTTPTWTAPDGTVFNTVMLESEEPQGEIVGSGTCGENLTWAFYEDGLLKITGVGAMDDWNYHGTPWEAHRQSINKVVIGNGVTSIGEYAFDDCPLLETITIGEGVEVIGGSAFRCCPALSEIVIPDSVKTMGEYVFNVCTNLKTVHIGSGLQTIGDAPFLECSSLQKIDVSENNLAFSNDESGVLLSHDKTILYHYPVGRTENTYCIPDTVTKIVPFAFMYASNLEYVTFPNGLRSLGQEAFSYSNLKEIDIPGSVTFLDNAFKNCASLTRVVIRKNDPNVQSYVRSSSGLFAGCRSLTSFEVEDGHIALSSIDGVLYDNVGQVFIQYPLGRTDAQYTIIDGCETIEWRAFAGSEYIEHVSMPDSLSVIGWQAFERCTALKQVDVGSNVAVIEGSAFWRCSSLTEITLPSTLTTLEGHVFGENHALRKICFLGDVPEVLGTWAFSSIPENVVFCVPEDASGWTTPTWTAPDGTVFNTVMHESEEPQGEIVGSGTCGENLTWVFYEDGLLKITGVGAMDDWEQYETPWEAHRQSINKVVIGDGITSIGECAFCFCPLLETITIGKDVEAIGGWAFSCCHALSEIVIPDSVKRIGVYAFNGCTNLKTVHIGSGLQTIGSGPFIGCSSLQKFEVSEDNLAFSSDEYGVLFSHDKTILYYYPVGRTENTYCIPDAVTEIVPFAFMYASNLEYVMLPNGLRALGQEAFSYTNLKEIDIPGSVTFLDNAFSNCASLTRVVIRKHDPDVHMYTRSSSGLFEGCRSLTSFEVEDGHIALRSIDGVLYDNVGQVFIQYPLGRTDAQYTIIDGCEEIERSAFAGSEYIEHVSMPDSLSVIGMRAFYDCTALKQVDVGSNVAVIDEQAFLKCSSLTEITLPRSLTTLEGNVFGDDPDLIDSPLKKICFLGDVPEFLDPWAFSNMSESVVFCVPEDASGWTTPTWTAPDGRVFNTVIHRTESSFLLGDANHDGKADSSDAVAILRKLAGYDVPNFYEETADFNGDGKSDSSDAVAILRKLAGY